MSFRTWSWSLLALSLGCTKEATPLALETLVPPVGHVVPAFCTKAIDGKRFVVEGAFSLPDPVTVNEKDFVDLELSGASGRGIRVQAKDGTHLESLTAQMQEVTSAGYRQVKGALPKNALRIRAKGGEELLEGQQAVATIEVEVLTKFQSDDVSACVFHFVEARRR